MNPSIRLKTLSTCTAANATPKWVRVVIPWWCMKTGEKTPMGRRGRPQKYSTISDFITSMIATAPKNSWLGYENSKASITLPMLVMLRWWSRNKKRKSPHAFSSEINCCRGRKPLTQRIQKKPLSLRTWPGYWNSTAEKPNPSFGGCSTDRV